MTEPLSVGYDLFVKNINDMTGAELYNLDAGQGFTLGAVVTAFFYDEVQDGLNKIGITNTHWKKVQNYISQGFKELYPNFQPDCKPNEDYLSIV